jgi:SAM-dependent methyltransferase
MYLTHLPDLGGDWSQRYALRRQFLRTLIGTYLPPDRGISILDLGCGSGHLMMALKEMGYKNIKGVDISGEQVQIAHQNGLSEVQLGSVDSFLKKNKGPYDAVFMMDLLEHLDKQELFDLLDKVAAVMGKNGRLILHVPNAEGLFGMRMRYGDLTHENIFTPSSMTQCLQACGFGAVRCYEDRPLVHGFVSLIRLAIWTAASTLYKVVFAAETGIKAVVASQNMFVTANLAESPRPPGGGTAP